MVAWQRVVLGVLVVGVIAGGSASAVAQDACGGRGAEALDVLAVSRRARSVLQTRGRFDAEHTIEQAVIRGAQARHAGEGGRLPRRTYYFEWMGETSELSGYELCTSDGQLKAAGLAGGWNGFALGVRDWEADWSARIFLVYTGDSISPDDFRADPNAEGPQFSDEILGTGQAFYGLTAQYTEWAALTLGVTQESRTLFDIRTQDGQTTSDSSLDLVEGSGNRRLYLGVGVPKLFANVDLIVDPGAKGLAYSFFGVRDLPMFFVDMDWSATAGVGNYTFEDQFLSELGTRYALFGGKLTPAVDLAFEWRSPRLRSARARLDAALAGDWKMPRGFLTDNKNPRIDLADLITWFGAGVGAYGEVSVYNSAYLEDVTGRSMARGWLAGGWGMLSSRVMTLRMDVFGGVNRVETLTRLADAVDRREFGLKVHLRFGW